MPGALRTRLSNDPEYGVCARSGEGCRGRITYEHAILYAGKQVQERWAIIPLCEWHHLDAGLDKRWNIKYAMSRATEEDKKKYPKLKWQ